MKILYNILVILLLLSFAAEINGFFFSYRNIVKPEEDTIRDIHKTHYKPHKTLYNRNSYNRARSDSVESHKLSTSNKYSLPKQHHEIIDKESTSHLKYASEASKNDKFNMMKSEGRKIGKRRIAEDHFADNKESPKSHFSRKMDHENNAGKFVPRNRHQREEHKELKHKLASHSLADRPKSHPLARPNHGGTKHRARPHHDGRAKHPLVKTNPHERSKHHPLAKSTHHVSYNHHSLAESNERIKHYAKPEHRATKSRSPLEIRSNNERNKESNTPLTPSLPHKAKQAKNAPSSENHETKSESISETLPATIADKSSTDADPTVNNNIGTPANTQPVIEEHSEEQTATNGEQTATNGEQTVTNGETTVINGEQTITNGETTVTNGEVASQPVEVVITEQSPSVNPAQSKKPEHNKRPNHKRPSHAKPGKHTRPKHRPFPRPNNQTNTEHQRPKHRPFSRPNDQTDTEHQRPKHRPFPRPNDQKDTEHQRPKHRPFPRPNDQTNTEHKKPSQSKPKHQRPTHTKPDHWTNGKNDTISHEQSIRPSNANSPKWSSKKPSAHSPLRKYHKITPTDARKPIQKSHEIKFSDASRNPPTVPNYQTHHFQSKPHKAKTLHHNPSSGLQKIKTVNSASVQASTIADKSSTDADPTVNNNIGTPTNAQPVIEEQTVTNGEQIVTNGEQTVTNGEQIVTNGEQTAANGGQTATNGEITITNGEDTISEPDEVIVVEESTPSKPNHHERPTHSKPTHHERPTHAKPNHHERPTHAKSNHHERPNHDTSTQNKKPSHASHRGKEAISHKKPSHPNHYVPSASKLPGPTDESSPSTQIKGSKTANSNTVVSEEITVTNGEKIAKYGEQTRTNGEQITITNGERTVTNGEQSITNGGQTAANGEITITNGEDMTSETEEVIVVEDAVRPSKPSKPSIAAIKPIKPVKLVWPNHHDTKHNPNPKQSIAKLTHHQKSSMLPTLHSAHRGKKEISYHKKPNHPLPIVSNPTKNIPTNPSIYHESDEIMTNGEKTISEPDEIIEVDDTKSTPKYHAKKPLKPIQIKSSKHFKPMKLQMKHKLMMPIKQHKKVEHRPEISMFKKLGQKLKVKPVESREAPAIKSATFDIIVPVNDDFEPIRGESMVDGLEEAVRAKNLLIQKNFQHQNRPAIPARNIIHREITSCYGLNSLVLNNPSFVYVLKCDLDCAQTKVKPIGSLATPFMGIFDGRGHTIYNLQITDPNYAALFAVTSSATIRNLNLVNVNVTGVANAGALVAFSYSSTFRRAQVLNSTITGGMDVGGLIAFACKSTIVGCASNKVNVVRKEVTLNLVTKATGGLIGEAQECKIKDCLSVETVITFKKSIGDFLPSGGLVGILLKSQIANAMAETVEFNGTSLFGGMVGYAESSNMTECSTRNVSFATEAQASWIAGLVAYSQYSNISDSMCEEINFKLGSFSSSIGGAIGSLTESGVHNCGVKKVNILTDNADLIGGFAGFSSRSVLRDIFTYTFDLDTKNSQLVGGFVGQAISSTFDRIDVTQGKIIGNSYLGGMFGSVEAKSQVLNSNVTYVVIQKDATESRYLGGLAGMGISSAFVNCHNRGPKNKLEIFIQGEKYVGGLTGYCNDCHYSKCGVKQGRIAGEHSVGGISGGLNVKTNFKPETISELYTTSNVAITGVDVVGGLIGELTIEQHTSLVFANSYSRAELVAQAFKAGFFGVVSFSEEYSYVEITDSYAANMIEQAANCTAGLVGAVQSSNALVNSDQFKFDSVLYCSKSNSFGIGDSFFDKQGVVVVETNEQLVKSTCSKFDISIWDADSLISQIDFTPVHLCGKKMGRNLRKSRL